jgi:GNAT superfamily N-acetyltransferase
VLPLVALRAAVAERLTAQHGKSPWSHTSTEKGVLLDMRTSQVLVAREDGTLIATLRLATKKPWAIDPTYFHKCQRPIYLLSMAVKPELQGRGIGRRCLDVAVEICRRWPADAVRLDAYDAAAGAGPFYAKSGFSEVGRKTYRGCPLIYYEKLL